MDYSRRQILLCDSQLGPYPLEKLSRVEKITTEVMEEIRPVQKDHELARCARGDYGEMIRERSFNSPSHNPMCEALWASVPYISAMPENPVAEQKAPIPEDASVMARHIKKYTYFLGAEQVGICRVPKGVLYQEAEQAEQYRYAIVFLQRKDPSTVAATHGDEWVDDAASWVIYQRLAVIATTLARYIRSLGYPAKASNCTNYSTLMPRLIVEAGLGEFSRMGIALNPFVGASFKAACVLTDLPLSVDKPIDFGLQNYCEHCGICAKQCPVHAIPDGEKVTYNGYHSWVLDKKKCALYCINHPHGDICQRCTKVCPFNRPDGTPEQFKDWDGNLDYLYSLVEKQKEHMESNDFEEPAEKTDKWWLPIREDNGVMGEKNDFDYSIHQHHQARVKNQNGE